MAASCKALATELRPLLSERRAVCLYLHLCSTSPHLSWTREDRACLTNCTTASLRHTVNVVVRGTLEERNEGRFVCVVPTLDLTVDDVRGWTLPTTHHLDPHPHPLLRDLEVTAVEQRVFGGAFADLPPLHFKQIVPIVVTFQSFAGTTLRLEGDVAVVSYRNPDIRSVWKGGETRFAFASHVNWERMTVA